LSLGVGGDGLIEVINRVTFSCRLPYKINFRRMSEQVCLLSEQGTQVTWMSQS
jgi:hypothetical protein